MQTTTLPCTVCTTAAVARTALTSHELQSVTTHERSLFAGKHSGRARGQRLGPQAPEAAVQQHTGGAGQGKAASRGSQRCRSSPAAWLCCRPIAGAATQRSMLWKMLLECTKLEYGWVFVVSTEAERLVFDNNEPCIIHIDAGRGGAAPGPASQLRLDRRAVPGRAADRARRLRGSRGGGVAASPGPRRRPVGALGRRRRPAAC